MRHILLFGLLSLATISVVAGACMTDILRTRTVYGDVPGSVEFCKYKDTRFLIGTSLTTDDCMACDCSKTGMKCCSYGAGLMTASDFNRRGRCVPRNKNCEVVWVRRRNPNKRCRRRNKLGNALPANGTMAE